MSLGGAPGVIRECAVPKIYFDERIASTYDTTSAKMLRERGIRVHGIDVSPPADGRL
jgi:hypothetical protein